MEYLGGVEAEDAPSLIEAFCTRKLLESRLYQCFAESLSESLLPHYNPGLQFPAGLSQLSWHMASPVPVRDIDPNTLASFDQNINQLLATKLPSYVYSYIKSPHSQLPAALKGLDSGSFSYASRLRRYTNEDMEERCIQCSEHLKSIGYSLFQAAGINPMFQSISQMARMHHVPAAILTYLLIESPLGHLMQQIRMDTDEQIRSTLLKKRIVHDRNIAADRSNAGEKIFNNPYQSFSTLISLILSEREDSSLLKLLSPSSCRTGVCLSEHPGREPLQIENCSMKDFLAKVYSSTAQKRQLKNLIARHIDHFLGLPIEENPSIKKANKELYELVEKENPKILRLSAGDFLAKSAADESLRTDNVSSFQKWLRHNLFLILSRNLNNFAIILHTAHSLSPERQYMRFRVYVLLILHYHRWIVDQLREQGEAQQIDRASFQNDAMVRMIRALPLAADTVKQSLKNYYERLKSAGELDSTYEVKLDVTGKEHDQMRISVSSLGRIAWLSSFYSDELEAFLSYLLAVAPQEAARQQ